MLNYKVQQIKIVPLAVDMVVNYICDIFQQKDYVETLYTKESMILKALPEEDFGQQTSLFFGSCLVSLI